MWLEFIYLQFSDPYSHTRTETTWDRYGLGLTATTPHKASSAEMGSKA